MNLIIISFARNSISIPSFYIIHFCSFFSLFYILLRNICQIHHLFFIIEMLFTILYKYLRGRRTCLWICVRCVYQLNILIRADLFAHEQTIFHFSVCRDSIAAIFRSITMTERAPWRRRCSTCAGTLVNFRRIGKRGIGYWLSWMAL